MKPWIKRTLFGLFGVSILVGGLTACGHRHGFGAPMSTEEAAEFRGKMIERVSSKLDLNADQKKRLTVLADKLHEQRLALVPAGKEPRADLQALVAGDKFDRTRAQTLVTEKTAAITSKSPEVIAAMADFYDSLNPAQQQKVREFMQKRPGWHRG
jgi:Spy/CpxP family protein refolding chaperone